jgi:hypothetical protein
VGDVSTDRRVYLTSATFRWFRLLLFRALKVPFLFTFSLKISGLFRKYAVSFFSDKFLFSVVKVKTGVLNAFYHASGF